jgi:acyl carrier protein phosphodiesterase
MAPDLLPLCGAVAVPETSPRVAAGQAHHRAVDAVFHANPAFTALLTWASGALRESGLGRGPARAVAHVGVELFLDGELARRARARHAYARSLRNAETTRAPFVWRDDTSRARWGALIARLRTGAVPDAYRDPDFVADRLIGALSRRPRLALAEGEARTLRAFLPSLGARVAADAGALVGALV